MALKSHSHVNAQINLMFSLIRGLFAWKRQLEQIRMGGNYTFELTLHQQVEEKQENLMNVFRKLN